MSRVGRAGAKAPPFRFEGDSGLYSAYYGTYRLGTIRRFGEDRRWYADPGGLRLLDDAYKTRESAATAMLERRRTQLVASIADARNELRRLGVTL